jgi:hypothetical protein
MMTQDNEVPALPVVPGQLALKPLPDPKKMRPEEAPPDEEPEHKTAKELKMHVLSYLRGYLNKEAFDFTPEAYGDLKDKLRTGSVPESDRQAILQALATRRGRRLPSDTMHTETGTGTAAIVQNLQAKKRELTDAKD